MVPTGIVDTLWFEVEKQCAEWGDEFDAWQDGLGQVTLGLREDGTFAATVGGVVLSIPRQVAKTFLVSRIVFALCILFPNLTVLWTAHRTRTATQTFNKLKGLAQKPVVRSYMASGGGIRSVNGEQEFEFANGSKIMFGAREQGFGRGFDEVDVEVFDEAQILTEKALEDMVAATNQSRFPHGALLFFMGTPPRPIDPGEEFSNRRNEALSHKSADVVYAEGEDTLYVECSADPETGKLGGPSVDDPRQVEIANPSVPHRTPWISIKRLRKQLTSDDSWLREGLGVWEAIGSSSVIDPTVWLDRRDPASMAIERLSLAIAISPDRSVATVALGGQRADGKWHVEVDEQRSGTAWIAEHVANRCQRNNIRAVVIDGASQAASIVDDLQTHGVKVTVTGLRELAVACGGFYDAVIEGDLRHIDQPLLNASNGAAGKRAVFNGEAWVWTGKHTALDITPTQAVTLALWGAQNDSKVKKPVRKGGGRRVVTA